MNNRTTVRHGCHSAQGRVTGASAGFEEAAGAALFLASAAVSFVTEQTPPVDVGFGVMR